MIIKQISVFLENRVGRTKEVTQLLADNGIDIKAFCTADRSEFGVLRLVVSDTGKAVGVLGAAGFASVVTDVVSVNCPNRTGSLAQLLGILAGRDISVEYMYAFFDGERTYAVIRPSDLHQCVEAFAQEGL